MVGRRAFWIIATVTNGSAAPVLATDTIDRGGLDTPAVLLTTTGALTNRGCKSSRLNGLLTETVRVLFRNRAASESRELIDASTVDEQKPAVYIQHPAGGDVSDQLPLRSSGLTLRRSPFQARDPGRFSDGDLRWHSPQSSISAEFGQGESRRLEGHDHTSRSQTATLKQQGSRPATVEQKHEVAGEPHLVERDLFAERSRSLVEPPDDGAASRLADDRISQSTNADGRRRPSAIRAVGPQRSGCHGCRLWEAPRSGAERP